MKNIKFLLFLFLFISISCTNYESEKYLVLENSVVKLIIPELINLKGYEIDNIANKKIHLVSELSNRITPPIYYEILEEERALEKFLEEKELFEPFTTGAIKKRKLNIEIRAEDLNITQISKKAFEKSNLGNKLRIGEQDNDDIVYLIISRILFNKHFNYGYLNFTVYCGEGCYWTNNLEIKKVEKKWVIARIFSGVIS